MNFIKRNTKPLLLICFAIFLIIQIRTHKVPIDRTEIVKLEKKLVDYSFTHERTGLKQRVISHRYYLDFIDFDKKVQISASILKAFDEYRFIRMIRKGDKLELFFRKSEIDSSGDKISVWGIAKDGMVFLSVDNAIRVYNNDNKTGISMCFIGLMVGIIWIVIKEKKQHNP